MAERRCGPKTWGFLATDVPDPPGCILSCRHDFLRGLLLEDKTPLDRVCEVLSDTATDSSVSHATTAAAATTVTTAAISTAAGPGTEITDVSTDSVFWALYCCDAQRCGVDNLQAGGEDPNVNWFINSCQNIGYSSLADPGPPDQTYKCDAIAVTDAETTRCEEQGFQSIETVTVEHESDFPTTITTPSITQTSMATQTYSSLYDPSLEANFDPSQSDDNDDGDEGDDQGHGGGLSSGLKITIALTTLAAVVIIILALVGVLRYRARPPHRRNLCGFIKRKYHSLYSTTSTSPPSPPLPPSSPARPLLSPKLGHRDKNSVPLTPPLPLKERRLLSGASPTKSFNHNRIPSVPGQVRPRGGIPMFPTSPVFAPTRGNLARRSMGFPPRSQTTGPLPPAPVTASPPVSPKGLAKALDGSFGSISSGPTSTSSIISGAATRGTSTSTYHRPHVATLDLASLRSPGPPPNRALPSTPPNSYISPYSPTATSPVRPGDIGVAVGLVARNPASGIVLGQDSQEICDLNNQTGSERQRTSSGTGWPSNWRGYGGGSATPPVNRSTESVKVSSPALEEIDLERMAGRY